MRLANKFGFTLKEYVSAVNKRPEAKSVLNYCPDDRYLHLNVTKWGAFGKKTCFLDDIMKIEKKKLAPTHYKSAAHEQWSERLSSKEANGHTHKGKFLGHERETSQQELMRRTKKENLPAPGCYSPKQPEPGKMKF